MHVFTLYFFVLFLCVFYFILFYFKKRISRHLTQRALVSNIYGIQDDDVFLMRRKSCL